VGNFLIIVIAYLPCRWTHAYCPRWSKSWYLKF